MEKDIVQILKIHFYLHRDKYFDFENEMELESDSYSDSESENGDFIVNVKWHSIEGENLQHENDICNRYYALKIKESIGIETNDSHFEALFSLFKKYILEK